MKLADLLEIDPRFETPEIGQDPESGRISWKVEYTPLHSLNKNLDKIYTDFKNAATKHPEDIKLQEFLDTFALFKKLLRTHITKNYKKN
jgi:hypothetical protein